MVDTIEINKQLAGELLNILVSTKNFVIAQAPDIVQQVLNYSWWMYFSWIIVYAFLWFVGFFLIPFVITKKNRKEYGWDGDTWGPVRRAWLFTLTLSVPLFVDVIPSFIKINVAPKIFLIEYFSRLLR